MRKLLLWICAVLVAVAVVFAPWRLTATVPADQSSNKPRGVDRTVYQCLWNPPTGYKRVLAQMHVYPNASVSLKMDQLILELVGIGVFAGLVLAATKKREP
jgi:hypothetical protein